SALAEAALERHVTAVRERHAPNERETDPAARRLGRIEVVEDALGVTGVDPAAGVGHAQQDAARRASIAARLDAKDAAARHGLDRVSNEVLERAGEELRIGVAGRKRLLEIDLEIDAVPGREALERHDAPHDV